MFKVAIIGGENRGDYRLFVEKCAYFLKNKIKEGIRVLTIGDEYVNIMCNKANIDVTVYNTNWGAYGRDALKRRNEKIINDCDAVIAFEDGTNDTKAFIHFAKQSDKPVRVVPL